MTTFFSRFPDNLTPETRPISLPEIYTLHEAPNDLVMTVRWTIGRDGWEQHTPLFAEGIKLALEMVPPEGIPVPDCPVSFALMAFEVRP